MPAAWLLYLLIAVAPVQCIGQPNCCHGDCGHLEGGCLEDRDCQVKSTFDHHFWRVLLRPMSLWKVPLLIWKKKQYDESTSKKDCLVKKYILVEGLAWMSACPLNDLNDVSIHKLMFLLQKPSWLKLTTARACMLVRGLPKRSPLWGEHQVLHQRWEQ